MDKIVLITGATSGFGEACARKFAAAGCRIIITGRRKERLDKLAAELDSSITAASPTSATATGASPRQSASSSLAPSTPSQLPSASSQPSSSRPAAPRVLPLVFDVRDKEAVFAILTNLPEEWKKIDILINNAGLALGRDYFEEANLDDWETMIDTNVKGLLYASRAVAPYLIAQKGHIINLGSVAGKEVYEKGNVYCASKFAVDAISRSMRIDMLRHGIKVTAIHPGAADTEFSDVRFKGDKNLARQIYEGYTPLSAEDVADTIFYCASMPAHVCLNEIIITCKAQADAIYFYKGK